MNFITLYQHWLISCNTNLLVTGETECEAYGNFLYYLCNLYKFKTVLKLKFIKWKTKLTLFLSLFIPFPLFFIFLYCTNPRILVACSFFQRTSFNIFCMSLGNKFPHFYLRKFLFLFHILKDIFARYRILDWEEILLCFLFSFDSSLYISVWVILWMDFYNTVQEAVTKTIPKKKK